MLDSKLLWCSGCIPDLQDSRCSIFLKLYVHHVSEFRCWGDFLTTIGRRLAAKEYIFINWCKTVLPKVGVICFSSTRNWCGDRDAYIFTFLWATTWFLAQLYISVLKWSTLYPVLVDKYKYTANNLHNKWLGPSGYETGWVTTLALCNFSQYAVAAVC